MSDKTVKFTINIGGNAVSGVAKLSERVEALNSIAGKAANTLQKIGNAGMRLAGVIQSVQSIVAKAREFKEAYEAQVEAESKLAQVMRNTMGARASEIQSIKELAAAQQRMGVIGDEVQLAGAQELGTYLSKTSTLKKLMPVMNDMLAQQYGLNASQEQAAQIASMLGKVMDGQVGALSRYGYKFTKEQEKILKFGNEEQRAAVLAKVVGDAVGGMNKALSRTSAGKVKQLANSWGDLKESVGALANKIQVALVPVAGNLIRKLQGIVEVPLPQQIAREKVELNSLVGALIENYDKEDERKRLIDEIQAKYPDFLKNINLEKTTTDELKTALKGVNEEYDKRMKKAALERRLAKYDEKAEGAMDDIVAYHLALDAQQKRRSLKKEINDKLAQYEKETGNHYYYSENDHKVYRLKGPESNRMLLPHGLSDDKETAVQILIDEYDAQGKLLTTWGNDAKKLKKAEKKYQEYLNGRNIIQGMIDQEFGAEEKTEEKPKEDPTETILNETRHGVESAVTGGTRSTTVNINLGKMIEQVVFNGSWEETSGELESKVQECLYRVLALAATV